MAVELKAPDRSVVEDYERSGRNSGCLLQGSYQMKMEPSQNHTNRCLWKYW